MNKALQAKVDKVAARVARRMASEGTNEQGALRDLLTDMRHFAHIHKLDFDLAVEGSEEVFKEEIEE